MQKHAPWAPFGVINTRFLFSSRLNPRSLVYQPVYENFSIPALALK